MENKKKVGWSPCFYWKGHDIQGHSLCKGQVFSSSQYGLKGYQKMQNFYVYFKNLNLPL
jgi:hypothetical protein